MTTPAAVADALTKESYSSNNNGNNHDEVLRYRHSKHAGNHGDVLKHAILVELLLSLLEETPKIVFVDTHAGTGKYTLSKDGEEARKGILKLMADNCECIQMSPSLQDYLSLVQSFQPQDHQTKNDSLEYPGSPLLVQTILKTYAKKYWHYSFEWNPSVHPNMDGCRNP